MRKILVVLFAAASVICTQAQTATRVEQLSERRGPGRDQPSPNKDLAPTSEQKKYGTELLAHAEGAARSLDGGMRSFALLQVARGYRNTDRGKTIELLQEAFESTRAIERTNDHDDTRTRVQEDILRMLAPVSPAAADELLSQAEPRAQQGGLESLLSHYEESKKMKRAVDLIYRISREAEFPYGTGARVMAKLPDESPDVRALFTTALNSYRAHAKEHQGFHRGGDLTQLVLEFWQQLPPELVKDAIDEVLKQANPDENKDIQPGRIAVASDKGSVSFNSNYDYKLFQLLPVLRKLDESAANKLLEKNMSVKQALAQYPDGLAQNSGPRGGGANAVRGGNQRARGNPTMASFGVGGSVDASNMQAEVAEMSRAAQIIADADKDPEGALARVPQLTKTRNKLQSYVGIAETCQKQKPSAARAALRGAMEELERVDEPMEQVIGVRRIADLYLRMNETDDARKVIEKGVAMAEKIYKRDTDGNDPNKALKAYWPSAEAYRSLLRLAGAISPVWALELLKEVPDAEIKATAEGALALAWLGEPAGPTTIMTSTKNNNSVMMMRD